MLPSGEPPSISRTAASFLQQGLPSLTRLWLYLARGILFTFGQPSSIE
jgi:hypothetical protein